ncbi:MAG: Nitrite reductase, partial [Pedobacter sp.]|nr:Nitrite reductase [Pedobacter sp.]
AAVAETDESFNDYYDRNGKDYFYQLLKPVADLTTLTPDEYVDWGHEETFQTAIGVGECAGVMIDLVSTLLLEGQEKLGWAKQALLGKAWADAIYHSYAVFVNSAKALLLDKGVNCSTQNTVIKEFDTHYVETSEVVLGHSFTELVLQLNKNEPTEEFAQTYFKEAELFYTIITAKREAQFQV